MDSKYFEAFAIELAMQAGLILKKGFGTSFTTKTKSNPHDLVTEYDFKSEEAILTSLHKKYPHHSYLAEESGKHQIDKKEVLWIIDPLDGTVNFAHHIPVFAVSIAACIGNKLLCGVIYNPITQELFHASLGNGAFLNDKPIEVSHNESLKNAFLATGFPSNLKDNPNHCIEHFNHILRLGTPIRRLGAAAIDLAYIAAGRFDAFWEVVLSPWDFAAGALIIKEAGGIITQMNGEAIHLHHPNTIVASNGKLHKNILKHLEVI